MKIVTIIPFKKGIWKENLTYFSSKEIKNGSIVNISLRNKETLGLVVSSSDLKDAKGAVKDMSFNLKKVLGVKKYSILKPEFLESAILCSKYFIKNTADVISSLIPKIVKEEYDHIVGENILKSDRTINISNIKNEKLLFQAKKEDRILYYRTSIRENFAQKKSIFIVLPTKQDIEIFDTLLSKGIEQFVITIHSGLSKKKQIEKIKTVINSPHPLLVLGTPLFLSIINNNFKTIILEHESSNTYRSIIKPYFDLRVFIEILASKMNAKLILSDTLLRFETIARREIDDFIELQPLSFRIPYEGEIEVIGRNASDIKKEKSNKKFNVLMDKSIEEMNNTLVQNKKVFIFTLRKGLATYTVCKDCGETVNCKECLLPMVLYVLKNKKERIFICNRCGKNEKTKTTCSICSSWNLMPLGIGIDTLYEELKLNKNYKVFKLDKETAKNTNGAQKIIQTFEENNDSILIGTEISLYYLNNKTDLSIIASFDSLWSIPNFKMSEKIIQIVFMIMTKTNRKLIIQTKTETDPILLALTSGNILSYVRDELKERKAFEYPPYKRFIKITYQGNKEETLKIKNYLEEFLKEYKPIIYNGFIGDSKGNYITNILIKMDIKKWSHPSLTTNSSIEEGLLNKLFSLSSRNPAFEISVDPENLL